MKDWFAGLNQREQVSLLVMGLALALYLVYTLAIAPLQDKRDQLELHNSGVASSLRQVDAMVSEILQLRDGGERAGPSRNLTSVINQSTTALNLQVSRLQPNSRGEIQVRLENASFDDLLAWLYQIEYPEGLLLREVSITQAGVGGRVNATVRIAQAG